MSIHGGRSFGRGVVAVCAAGALLVSLMASPASASDAPNDTSIKGLLKGGKIVLHQDGEDMVFPLGLKDESGVKDKTEESVCSPKVPKEPRSYFTADVDDQGNAGNFVFHFAQGSTGEKFNIFTQQYEICARLDVKNAGQVQGSVNGKVMTLNPGPLVSTDFIIKRKPQGDVAYVCRVVVPQDTHTGEFLPPKELEDKQPHDWNLVHEPDTQPFLVAEVQSTSECPSFIANELNDSLGLETTGEAWFKWAVYDCSLKDCNDIEGHPNK